MTRATRVQFWRGKRVLVTGIGGFVGGHLAATLAGLGASVTGIIRDSRGEKRLALLGSPPVDVVHGTLTDAELVERVLNEYEIEYCFHLAAQAIVGAANRAPVSTFDSNIRGSWCVLEAARNAPILKGLIFASTDKVYGDQPVLPYTEDSALAAKYPYDASKLCAEILAHSYAETFGLRLAILRCANIYGGGDLNWSRLIPGTARSVLEGEAPIIRSDGTLKRDYLYIDDAVDAYLTLGENLDRPEVPGQAFNFGWSRGHSVLEVVEAILEGSHRTDLRPVVLNEAKGEIQHQWLSSEKARIVLDWRPETPLREGIALAVDWYADYLGLSGDATRSVAVSSGREPR
jgi:CDP-glucose 4,6-dehydratase